MSVLSATGAVATVLVADYPIGSVTVGVGIATVTAESILDGGTASSVQATSIDGGPVAPVLVPPGVDGGRA